MSTYYSDNLVRAHCVIFHNDGGFECQMNISSLSKSGQSILRTGSVSDKNPGEKISRSSSSRSSVSDRLKKFEVIDATAINEKRVLNNPRRSLRTSQSKN